jgi:hypothetical protein
MVYFFTDHACLLQAAVAGGDVRSMARRRASAGGVEGGGAVGGPDDGVASSSSTPRSPQTHSLAARLVTEVQPFWVSMFFCFKVLVVCLCLLFSAASRCLLCACACCSLLLTGAPAVLPLLELVLPLWRSSSTRS